MEAILLWIETIYSETSDLELQSKSINFQMISLKMQIKAWRIFLNVRYIKLIKELIRSME